MADNAGSKNLIGSDVTDWVYCSSIRKRWKPFQPTINVDQGMKGYNGYMAEINVIIIKIEDCVSVNYYDGA